jgi:hypothetical protein
MITGILAFERVEAVSGLLGGVLDAFGEIAPERQVEAGGQVDDGLFGSAGCRHRQQAKRRGARDALEQRATVHATLLLSGRCKRRPCFLAGG